MMERITITLDSTAFETLETKRGRSNRSAFLNSIILNLNEDERGKGD